MSDAREDWREVLATGADCLPLDRLDAELSERERAHLESCARCQSELQLFHAMSRESFSEEEDTAAAAIAAELKKSFERPSNVVPFTKRRRNGAFAFAAAAMVALAVGAGFWIEQREPSIDGTIHETPYRGERFEAVSPIGELATAPNEFQWTAVPGTTRYSVTIMEVDRSAVWKGDTAATRITIPPSVAAQLLPGRTLLWQVSASNEQRLLASTATNSFHISPTPGRSLR